jgi:hypothetical protein
MCSIRGVPQFSIIQIRVVQERCDLEYPGSDYNAHFHSGISSNALLRTDGGHLFLELKSDHGQKDWDEVIDLTALQELMTEQIELCKHTIESRIVVAMQTEEEALERFRRKPLK